MISGLLLTALGAIAIALASLEIASVFVKSGNVAWSLVRRLSGRGVAPMSQMQAAMFWIQAFGLLLSGCVFVTAGLNMWER